MRGKRGDGSGGKGRGGMVGDWKRVSLPKLGTMKPPMAKTVAGQGVSCNYSLCCCIIRTTTYTIQAFYARLGDNKS